MSETPTPEPAPEAPNQTILQRIATPLLLFSGSLFVLLLLSFVFVLPRFTGFHREDGTALNPRELAEYERQLAADVYAQEQNRERLVLPIVDETYTELKNHKRQVSLLYLQEQLRLSAARLGEEKDVVQIAHITLENDMVTVSGDIRAGLRSMTVLASYIERIEELPIVQNLKRPAFAREQNADGSFHSPFTFSFQITE